MRHNAIGYAMTNWNDLPSPPDITLQLERITSSRTFATRPTPAKLLETIVKYDLKKEPISEYDLGIEVFAKPRGWNPKQENTVREQKRILRNLIDEYYADEGKEDAVLITVPKREGPGAKYIHNLRAYNVLLARSAGDTFEKTFPEMVAPNNTGPILRKLRDSISRNKTNASAHAKLGEILLFYTLCDQASGFSSKTSVPEAGNAAMACLSLDPEHWLGYVVKGAVHCCHFEWEDATIAFGQALTLKRQETESHFFYICFLAALGRMEEAVRCSESRIRSTDESELTFGPRSLLQYVQRKFGTAYRGIAGPSMKDINYNIVLFTIGKELVKCNYWTTYLLLACIEIGLQNPFLGTLYAEIGSQDSWVDSYMGLFAWASHLCGKRSRHEEHWRNRTHFSVKVIEEQADRFGPINLALVHMRLGRKREAVQELRKACEEHNPLMAWLHLWPVFDPLRNREDFKSLIELMNLPVEATESVYPAETWYRTAIDSGAQSLLELDWGLLSDQSFE